MVALSERALMFGIWGRGVYQGLSLVLYLEIQTQDLSIVLFEMGSEECNARRRNTNKGGRCGPSVVTV